MMATKRKATSEGATTPKRRQKQNVLDNADLIYEEVHSDVEYSPPHTPSQMSVDFNETPETPFSATSSRHRYPSEGKHLSCPIEGCDKAFNRPSRLQEHIRSHNNERIHKCDHDGCDKTFLRPSHLQHHIKSAHTTVRDYVCDQPDCGKSFVSGSRLRRHQATHEGKDGYRCTEYPPCNETFRKHSTLQKHVMVVHLGVKPYPCNHLDPVTKEKCEMAFDTAGNLRTHQARVHVEKRFTCTECAERQQEQSSDMITDTSQDVSFPSYASLREHIQIVHPPQCPHCPLICSTTRELRRHLEVAHGNVSLEQRKVFPCTVPDCGRSFTKQGNLNVHIRTVHEGEKRFVCGETDLSTSKKVEGWDGIGCGKRYGNKMTLEEHVRVTHMGLPNTRKRRPRAAESKQSAPGSVSTLSALTGQGYAEETRRQISCFFSDSCPHRFHRNYDLWVHMTSKHGCTEDDVQTLFMQRALLSDESGSGGNSLGIYGLGLDHDSRSYYQHSYAAGDHSSDRAYGSQSNDSSYLPSQPASNVDYLMQLDSMIPGHNGLPSANPVPFDYSMEH
ncbi:Zinc finger C2H2 [Penicillium sp. DV-2018c]|nr:Zinc finger C2H2 [Penicillium sp. DV-2018c]